MLRVQQRPADMWMWFDSTRGAIISCTLRPQPSAYRMTVQTIGYASMLRSEYQPEAQHDTSVVALFKILCVTQVAVPVTSACGLLPHATSIAALLKVLSVQHLAVQMMFRCGLLASRKLLSAVQIAALVRVLSVWMQPASTRQEIINDCQ